MNAIQKFKEWFNYEIEYTQTKVEKPNREKVALRLFLIAILFVGLIFAISFLAPRETTPAVVETTAREVYSLLEPYQILLWVCIWIAISLVILAVICIWNIASYYDKTEV